MMFRIGYECRSVGYVVGLLYSGIKKALYLSHISDTRMNNFIINTTDDDDNNYDDRDDAFMGE